jgi:hypothetical protein
MLARVRDLGALRAGMFVAVALLFVWSPVQPIAEAHIQHFTHFLQVTDDCYPQNCPHFLATTRRIDGANDFIYVELSLYWDSDPYPEFFDSKVCYGGCYVKRVERAGFPAKHNRSYTIDAASGHACGHSDGGDDDCRYFSDSGSYDSSYVCQMAITPLTGHCHRYENR